MDENDKKKDGEKATSTTSSQVTLTKSSPVKSQTPKSSSSPTPTQAYAHVVVVMGASGDLARKSIYPALWQLYRGGHLPDPTFIVGFARSKLTVNDLRERCNGYAVVAKQDHDLFKEFWRSNFYVPGSYTDVEQARDLNRLLDELEGDFDAVDRTFYLALPPSVYESVTALVKEHWMAGKGRTKVVLEKPFGRDLATSDDLNRHLTRLFKPDEFCRVDHYLCLEMVQAILSLRFANQVFAKSWNNQSIRAILITFKEDFGTYGRGGYFDNSGMIRDVMQNHLLQILCLVAMEQPQTDSDADLRYEKQRVLRAIRPVQREDVVLGQYVGNPEADEKSEDRYGYLDDATVDSNSNTATFATMVFYVDNERWDGVPFIMRCGKALDEHKDEVRIQFGQDRSAKSLFPDQKLHRNELVVQLKPKEKIGLRINLKSPGLDTELRSTELDLCYDDRYDDLRIVGPYERLLLSIIRNEGSAHFVGTKELYHSWKLFTPILEQIESEQRKPLPYVFGSTGPKEADKLCERKGFLLSETYPW